MNVSRRIRCKAANAFTPALALNNVFSGITSLRAFALKVDTSEASLELRTAPSEQPPVLSKEQWRQSRTSLIRKRLLGRKGPAPGLAHGTGKASKSLEQINGGQEGADETMLHDERIVKGHVVNKMKDAFDTADPLNDTGLRIASDKLDGITQKKVASQGQDVLEYDGRYVLPVGGYRPSTRRQPWLQEVVQSSYTSSYKRLGAEVAAFAKWIHPTKAEETARKAAIDQTVTIVQQSLANHRVELFGSSCNGLALASSDIDLRLYHHNEADEADDASQTWLSQQFASRPPTRKARMANVQALHRLQERFQCHPDYIFANIRYARYPLLHLQHKPSGYDVQIVCANDTSKQRARIARYLGQYPYLYDLYAVLKTTLETRGLTDVFRGGIGSYNLLIMIVAVLNKAKIDDRAKTAQSSLHVHKNQRLEKLGFLLLRILRFYGTYLDTYKNTVSADPYAIVPKLDPESLQGTDQSSSSPSPLHLADHSQPYLLCLVDPEDSTNDLGRQAYGWKHIQETLRFLHRGCTRRLRDSGEEETKSYLVPLVGSAATRYSSRRLLAESFGSKILEEPLEFQKHVEESAQSMIRKMKAEEAKRLESKTEPKEAFPRGHAITSADETGPSTGMENPADGAVLESVDDKMSTAGRA